MKSFFYTGHPRRVIFGSGALVALKNIGIRAIDLDCACEIALQNQYPNPRPLEYTAIHQLLQDAIEGRHPSFDSLQRPGGVFRKAQSWRVPAN